MCLALSQLISQGQVCDIRHRCARLQDQYENVILNLYVRPQRPVVSYLTPLTGCGLCRNSHDISVTCLYIDPSELIYFWLLYRLTQEMLESRGMPMQEALHVLRQYLPRSAILVGQSVGKDVDWLQLREGQDYQVCDGGGACLMESLPSHAIPEPDWGPAKKGRSFSTLVQPA